MFFQLCIIKNVSVSRSYTISTIDLDLSDKRYRHHIVCTYGLGQTTLILETETTV